MLEAAESSGGGKVPLIKEMAEEVNVLVFGHPGSGKSSIISKVLELGGQLTKEQIESYKTKSKDDNQIEEKPDWYLHYAKAAKKPKPTFARTFYQAEGRKFTFLEFQSEEDYVPKLMMKTKKATIGVLVLSGAFRDEVSELESFQTRKYIQLFCAIRGSPESVFHVSPKLIVLINKKDAKTFHSGALKKSLAGYLECHGFDSSKVEIISFSSRNDEDIRSFLSRLRALAASKNNCLRSGEATDPRDSIFKLMWDNLIITDILLDANFIDKSLWHKRAETLYQAATNLLKGARAVESLEASRILKVACKAAEKAITDDEDDILLCLILSHGNYESGNHQVAINHYEKAKLASKDKHLEDNIKSYLSSGEIRVDKAKKLVEASKQIAKSRRQGKQKVENKVGKSDARNDAKEDEEVVRDKPVDLETPRKIAGIC